MISVVIPAYNSARYIAETLDSVFDQTYGNMEVIVVDDGSTDETRRILSRYSDRIRLLGQANQGRAAACNAGVAQARGEWVAFLDSDDMWLPDKLTRQCEACADCVMSCTNAVLFGDGICEILRSDVTALQGGWVLERLLLGNFIMGSSVMIRRSVFEEYGGFDPTLWVEDWPLWMKVCADHELGYVASPLLRYRLHRESMTFKVRKAQIAHRRILEDAFGQGGVAERLQNLRRQAFANSFQVNAHYAAAGGDWRFALWCALHSLWHDPFAVRTWKTFIKAGLIPCGVEY